MTAIPTTVRPQHMAIRIDRICDYIPLASSLIAIVNIFGKCVCRCFKSSSSLHDHVYVAHLENKPLWRCLILLCVIGFGSLIIFFYDRIQNDEEQQEAQRLGITPEELPRDAAERTQLLEDIREINSFDIASFNITCLPVPAAERQQLLNDIREAQSFEITRLSDDPAERQQILSIQRKAVSNEVRRKVVQWYARAIHNVGLFLNKFHYFIAHPTEPVTVRKTVLVIVSEGQWQATPLEKHDALWSEFKRYYLVHEFGEQALKLDYKLIMTIAKDPVTDLHKDPIFIEGQQRLSKLESELFGIRRNSYKDLIAKLNPEELLAEARQVLLDSFRGKKGKAKKEAVNKLTIQQILPELKKQCTKLAAEPIRVIEMQELILRMEALHKS
jgi:hypothetical protein